MPTFIDPLLRALQVGADRTAVLDEGKATSYRELWTRCRKLVGMVSAKGAVPGDRIAILADNSPQYLEMYVGLPAAGFVIVPLNTRHAEPELHYALEDAGAKLLITDRAPGTLSDLVDSVISVPDDYEGLVENAAEMDLGIGISEDTLAGLFYTGGTTGASKGVMLSHRNLIANAMHNMTIALPSQENVWLVMAPMFHAAGTNSVLLGIWSASCQIPLRVFDPATALDLIEQHGVTHTLGVPAMIAAITELQLKEPRDTSTLQLVLHGGSPIATEVIRRAHTAFPSAGFGHVYGATETSPLVTGMRNEELYLDEPRGRSCGQALVGVQIKIVDEQGNELPTGEVGEVATSGANVMLGYWQKPEQTAEVLRDGWYHTGDLGRFDADGYLYLVDRAKDMIVTGGENVYCSEVEEALYKHPAVLEAAVIGIPDGKWGEAVHAVVVPREAIGEEELVEFCREHIAGYKLPKSITFSETELPKSGPGKILKRELRKPFWEGKEEGIN